MKHLKSLSVVLVLLSCNVGAQMLPHTLPRLDLSSQNQTATSIQMEMAKVLAEFGPAANAGDPVAQNTLGNRYSKIGERSFGSQANVEAVKWYRKSADQGHANAQLNLGMMYRDGQGVPIDMLKMAEWLTKAGEQGNVTAQTILAIGYDVGLISGTPNYSDALKWYRQAAAGGSVDAQTNLGTMYDVDGGGRRKMNSISIGVQTNLKVALALYIVASENQPNVKTKYTRSTTQVAMSQLDISIAEKLARDMQKPGNFVAALDKFTEGK